MSSNASSATVAVTGFNQIAGAPAHDGSERFRATNPATGAALEPEFVAATRDEVDTALRAAQQAWLELRERDHRQRAELLRRMADEILELGDTLIERCCAETGLPAARVTAERGRTVGQLRMFADLVEEGSWVDARIDTAQPQREPLPKPDLRRMLRSLGPVVVFGASNFPLAFSAAGGDTASALAAGCPVVVKAHRSHPGTGELVGQALSAAIAALDLPAGTFSLLHGSGAEVGMALVTHPLTRAVGFTGSHTAGRALCDAAAARPEPIPVYAEMGSINPVFVLPEALASRSQEIATGLEQSLNLGVGQFCTNPGLVVGLDSPDLQRLVEQTGALVAGSAPGTMLSGSIRASFAAGTARLAEQTGVALAAQASSPADAASNQAGAALFATDAATFLGNQLLSEEVFGPATVVVRGQSQKELLTIAEGLSGHLTATIHGTENDLAEHAELVAILERKVGRLIFNGFPTGVEVCASMNHGGPYPASSDPHFTSVGTAAIYRFARPLSYQGFPDAALPGELQNANPRGVLRLVDGQYTREPLPA